MGILCRLYSACANDFVFEVVEENDWEVNWYGWVDGEINRTCWYKIGKEEFVRLRRVCI